MIISSNILRHVFRLALETEDRTDDEQAAMLAVAELLGVPSVRVVETRMYSAFEAS